MPIAIQIAPGKNVHLSKIDPSASPDFDKEEGQARLVKLGRRLAELQELLFAAGDHSLLIVLQGRDTAGKDGTIKKILEAVNVQSTRVASFKVPTAEELAHDFLWRVHRQTPGLGEIVIFNRSHYEDVLVVRVHNLVPEKVWRPRYEAIRNFEELLVQSGTILVKFMLHISPDEQEERLLAREEDPLKSWKLSVGDWKERAHWDAYTEAYEEALSECSTESAPWHVIPANKKWARDLAVFEILIAALEPYEAEWRTNLEARGKEAKAELVSWRESQK